MIERNRAFHKFIAQASRFVEISGGQIRTKCQVYKIQIKLSVRLIFSTVVSTRSRR